MIRVAHPGWAGCPAFEVPVIPAVEFEGFVSPYVPDGIPDGVQANYYSTDKQRCIVIVNASDQAIQMYHDWPYATYLGETEYDPRNGLGHYNGARQWLDEDDLAYMGY